MSLGTLLSLEENQFNFAPSPSRPSPPLPSVDAQFPQASRQLRLRLAVDDETMTVHHPPASVSSEHEANVYSISDANLAQRYQFIREVCFSSFSTRLSVGRIDLCLD